MERPEIEIVRALYDAFNAGDLDGAAGLVSDDFQLTDVAAGQTLNGPDGCRQWLGMFRTALPDASAELVTVMAEGPRVATEHVGRGTHRGPLVSGGGTIPPTGRTIELRLAELFDVQQGRITALHAYYDSASLMRQLGLLPPQGSSAERGMTSLMALGVKAQQRIRAFRSGRG
ncbi:ester cyclase [Blastococcus colisei]|nr:ester cyclase [Blastococcus colisei]